MDEIRRVFQYHGAEHKTVYTFEANEDLTVENARDEVDAASALRHELPDVRHGHLDPGLLAGAVDRAVRGEVRRARRADPAHRRPGLRGHPLLRAPPRRTRSAAC